MSDNRYYVKYNSRNLNHQNSVAISVFIRQQRGKACIKCRQPPLLMNTETEQIRIRDLLIPEKPRFAIGQSVGHADILAPEAMRRMFETLGEYQKRVAGRCRLAREGWV